MTQTPAERRILADFPKAAMNAMQAQTDAAMARTDALLAHMATLTSKPPFEFGGTELAQMAQYRRKREDTQ